MRREGSGSKNYLDIAPPLPAVLREGILASRRKPSGELGDAGFNTEILQREAAAPSRGREEQSVEMVEGAIELRQGEVAPRIRGVGLHRPQAPLPC